jgi:hypothetical protein
VHLFSFLVESSIYPREIPCFRGVATSMESNHSSVRWQRLMSTLKSRRVVSIVLLFITWISLLVQFRWSAVWLSSINNNELLFVAEASVVTPSPPSMIRTDHDESRTQNDIPVVHAVDYSMNDRGGELFIHVQNWREGLAAWTTAFSEVAVAAKELNATLIEPEMSNARLVRDGKVRLSQVFNRSIIEDYFDGSNKFVAHRRNSKGTLRNIWARKT